VIRQPTLVLVPPALFARNQRRRCPEWWLSLVAAGGWLTLTAHTASSLAGRHRALAQTVASNHEHLASGLAGPFVMWAAMIAVMLPLIAPNVRYVAMRTPAPRRFRAAVDVVVGWLAIWAVAAVVLADASWLATRALGAKIAIAGFVALAIVWQYSRLKQLSVARCHRVFAPPLDPASAAGACRGFGILLGTDCVASCWAVMALMAVAGHSLFAVAPAFWILWSERRLRALHDPQPGQAAAVIAFAGLATLTVGPL
jgi:predicted metal-binding membrane protein